MLLTMLNNDKKHNKQNNSLVEEREKYSKVSL